MVMALRRLLPPVALTGLLVLPRAAAAEDTAAAAERSVTIRRPALATAAAAVPGFFVPGVGHWVAGEPATGRRLLIAKGIGFGAFAAGGVALFATGATRRASAQIVAVMVGGSGLWFIPWLADIYGVASGGAPTGDPRTQLPRLEVDAGWAHVRDPQFAYDHFTFIDADLGLGAFRIRPSAWFAVGADNQRVRLDVARRVKGVGARPEPGDGDFFELASAVSYHRYGDDAFDVGGVEFAARGRLDMVRIGPSLAGSFAEAELGVGWERVDYSLDGASTDYNSQLLARFGYGLALGRRGEATIYYDHRRDGYAQGLSPSENNGSGFLGSFGVDGFYYITSNVGLSAGYAMGAAHVARLAMRVQLGAAP